jgi:molybdate transport repressor ModE-like protein
MIDWNGFQVLLAVLEQGSFSAAARRTGLSQPTVGRHIAALEAALGARLVVRQKRGVLLTPAGERMIEDLKRMAQAAQDASQRGSEDVKQVDGVVRVSSTESLGTLWLTHRLRPLRERHPKLRIDIVVDNALVDLVRREADVALRLARPKQRGLVARPFGELGFGLFASPAYLDAHGTPRKREDLAKHDLIGLTYRGVAPPFMAWLHTVAPPERFVLSTTSLLAQQEAARAGWGIALAPIHMLASDPALRRVLPRVRASAADLWLVTHEDIKRSARVQVVYRAISAALSAERTGLAGL